MEIRLTNIVVTFSFTVKFVQLIVWKIRLTDVVRMQQICCATVMYSKNLKASGKIGKERTRIKA